MIYPIPYASDSRISTNGVRSSTSVPVNVARAITHTRANTSDDKSNSSSYVSAESRIHSLSVVCAQFIASQCAPHPIAREKSLCHHPSQEECRYSVSERMCDKSFVDYIHRLYLRVQHFRDLTIHTKTNKHHSAKCYHRVLMRRAISRIVRELVVWMPM